MLVKGECGGGALVSAASEIWRGYCWAHSVSALMLARPLHPPDVSGGVVELPSPRTPGLLSADSESGVGGGQKNAA